MRKVFVLGVLLLFACATDDDQSPGLLVLQSHTTGLSPDLDPDGYTIAGLSDGSFVLGANDSLSVELLPGNYVLSLSGLAGNCATATTQLTLRVRSEQRVEGAWTIACGMIPGQASVVFDPGASTGNGLVHFTIDAGIQEAVGPGDTLDLDLSPGSHQLVVGAFTPNCRITTGSTQNFTITRNQRTFVDLAGYCSPGTIAFDENVTVGNMNVWTMYRMESDSSGALPLSGPGISGGTFPALSPDGGQIAYVTSYDSLMVMNSDGSNPRLVTQVLNVSSPVWSPGGDRLAFYGAVGNPGEIYVVDVDGQNLLRLTSDTTGDFDPSWSPDGTRIAFASDRSGSNQIYTITPDGNDLDTLTTQGGYHPAWSPDGSRIAFVSGGAYQPWIMNADGTIPQPLGVPRGGYLSQLTWSPDGRFVAYFTTGGGVVYHPVDGSSSITVTRSGDPSSYRVSWGP